MQFVSDFLYVLLVDDEWWSKHDVVTRPAIDHSAHGIAHQSFVQRHHLQACRKTVIGVERLLGRPIRHKFQSLKQPSTADIADVRMIAETLYQTTHQLSAADSDVGKQIIVADHILDRKRTGTSGNMP